MILVTGASGNAGGAVLDAAMALNLPVKAMYRGEWDAEGAPKGAVPVIADFGDKASLSKALEGIEVVYLVCGPVPQLVELESNMIDACKEAGVRHIVLNSALGAGQFDKSFPSWHMKVEEKLKASGLDYTIIRPNGFMQNIAVYNATKHPYRSRLLCGNGRRSNERDRRARHRRRCRSNFEHAAAACRQNLRIEWAGSVEQC